VRLTDRAEAQPGSRGLETQCAIDKHLRTLNVTARGCWLQRLVRRRPHPHAVSE
jgi:hypothetical protein